MLVSGAGWSSDSLTPLTFEEWRYVIAEQTKDGYDFELDLRLYLRDVTVWINIYKTAAKPNPTPNQPDLEQYMVDFNFSTTKYDFYGNFSDEKTPKALRKFYEKWRDWEIESRQDKETTAKNAGFRINESYQDPDVWQYIIEPAY